MFKVVILGQGNTLISAIKGVLASQSDIVGVFDWESTKKFNFGRILKNNYLHSLIKKNKLHKIRAKSANSEIFKNEILRLNPDIIFVSTWGEKISEEVIKLAKVATINIHPSLLPKYRGPNPYSRVIMNGEKTTGITFHLMDKNFDSGAILLQKEVEIFEIDDYASLKTRLCAAIEPCIVNLLEKLDEEIIIPTQQDSSQATYFSHPSEEEIIISPKNETSAQISNKIRGLGPIQSCYIEYKSEFIKITKWEISANIKKADLSFKTKDGKYLLLYNPQIYGWFKQIFSKVILKFLLLSDKIK